jgi:hypothetical protein
LQRNTVLDTAAKLKAEDMAKNEYFSHFSPTGVSPWHWFDQAGYVYAHAGENLAIHFTDSSEVVEAWMDSPTHRQNIVNSLYTEIGVGTAKGKFDGYDTVYVVQLFGTPAMAKPVSVSNQKPAIITPEELVIASEVASQEEIPEVQTEVLSINGIEVESNSLQTTSGQMESKDNFSIKNEPKLAPSNEVEMSETIMVEDSITETPSEILSEKEVVAVESSFISTSSGLEASNVVTGKNEYSKVSVASIATQPNSLLQMVYSVIAFLVVFLLIVSVILDLRRLRLVQVAYGLLLLFGMGGLWYVNSLLTAGAVIV